MHPTALQGFERMIRATGLADERGGELARYVLDVGGADVNAQAHGIEYGVHGVLRTMIGARTFDVLDIEDGPGVALVGDATDPAMWRALAGRVVAHPYDLVVSTETLEHVLGWRDLVIGAAKVLRPGGWFIGTCAGYQRRPHGARGAHDPAPDEWYDNVNAEHLIGALNRTFDGEVCVEYSRRPSFPTTNDLYWRAQA